MRVGSNPPKYYAGGYLNSKEIQLALGVPLNMTGLSTAAWSGTLFRTSIFHGDSIS